LPFIQELAQRIALIVVPVPVVAGSMMLSSWAHEDPHAGARRNEVHTSDVPKRSVTDGRPPCQTRTSLALRCDRMAQQLTSRLNGGETSPAAMCHSIVRTPYVVAGDLEPAKLQQIFDETIRPSAAAMHREYFELPPTDPISILLFSDEATYRAYTLKLFGQSRTSIYGYYKPSVRTVVVNLGAGDGTIVHELTHALIDFDCPDLPIWMNEGIASLHEECQLEETPSGFRIRPLVNWRLAVLQEAIVRQSIRPTRELMMLDRLVGNNSEALNYAHARYFCMYLSEMGLLDDLYRLVRESPATEGSDRRALWSLISQLSVHGLDEDFQRWVMQLHLE
jgi:hypothetical protein